MPRTATRSTCTTSITTASSSSAVFEKEKPGPNLIVFKGRWYEGKDAQRTGRVRLILEDGHRTARGWYTYGDDEGSSHFDFKLRDCKR